MGSRWTMYYDSLAGRPPRPLLARALLDIEQPDPGAVAVELGCGDGVETKALLDAGWRVVAMDSSVDGVARTRARCAHHADRLDASVSTFEAFWPPSCRLLVSLHSLPFCDPLQFPKVWSRLRAALETGGTLVLTLFGESDAWAGTEGMTFLTRSRLDELLAGLDVAVLNEIDEDGGTAAGTTKHWHIWEVVARKRS